MVKEQIIKIAVDEILTTKEFCGDEKQAIRQVQNDFDIEFTKHELSRIQDEVQKKWSQFQDEAGVPLEKRLDDYERQKIMKEDEDDFNLSPR